MRDELGVSDTALFWFKSYLSDRQSRVSIHNTYSDPVDLEYGLPQGSILGPLMFGIYTLPLGNIIRHHNIDFHIYADDTQLYCSFDPRMPGAWQVAMEKLELCITDVQKLKLNENKTEVIVLGTPQNLKKLPQISLHIGDARIDPTDSVRNLGIMFDSHMTINQFSITKHKENQKVP